jgi:FtsP/CotA-like multicopper oxidase with cupredoxin domain
MNPRRLCHLFCLAMLIVCIAAWSASAQSFRVQCPPSTITHTAADNNSEPAYGGPTQFTCSVPNGCADICTAVNNCTPNGTATNNAGYLVPKSSTNGALKCQQISGGDGYATMGDGTQTYMFSFGPLSGLADIANGLPGTQFPNVFNTVYPGTTTLQPGDPATTVDASGPGSFTYNGAVGQVPRTLNVATISAIVDGPLPAGTPAVAGCPAPAANTVTVYMDAPLGLPVGAQVIVTVPGTPGYNGTFPITCLNSSVIDPNGFRAWALTYTGPTGLAAVTLPPIGTAATPPVLDGHVDPRPIMDIATMNGNIPAPLIAFDEDDEMFLTLTNVGMIMRPDLFEQHTVHFHGYPNASSFFDGVPDASVAINIGGSFTYYYFAPDAGTYFWHCHITPPEHLQMGMVGQLYIRPRQNRVTGDLYSSLQNQQKDPRTACNPASDILCSNSLPAVNTGAKGAATVSFGTGTSGYAYNDGDGSTYYDVEYPIQMHGFDPNFHFVGMTFNPEAFADMKDKYFLLNGRSYPDTVTPGPMETQSVDGSNHFSQPLPSIINIPAGKRALLRISNLSVSEYHTLASLGIPMQVIALNAKLLRDQQGHNLYYNTNSITLGGGESLDVILDASGAQYTPGQVFYLYTPNLDHLSNDAENFGGLMTEVRIK